MRRTFWLISLIIVIMLLFNMVSPVMAMSFSTIYERQTIQIVPENIEFDAFIEDTKDASLDINNEGKLVFDIKVKNTGYLKNASIILNSDSIELKKIDSDNIKAIKNNVIELNQIQYGNTIKLTIPFKYKKEERVKFNSLSSILNVKLDAVYVYGNNIQKRFNKKIDLKLNWITNKDSILNVYATRYLRYSDNNTMLSFRINDGIIDDDYPISSKGIEFEVPKINNKEPFKVIVIGEDISYKYDNGILKINKNNSKDSNNLIKWNSLSDVNLTFLYDSYSEELQNINLNLKSRITLVNGKDVEKVINNQINLGKQFGNIVNSELWTVDSLSKGQLYNNIDTEYKVNYKLDIGYAQLVDKMLITQNNNRNGLIKNKKISVDENNFKTILGNDGIINVYDINTKELIGTLKNDVLEMNIDNESIYFEISKPISEGILSIDLNKSLIGSESQKIIKLNSFDEFVNVKSFNENLKKSDLDLSKNIKLTEPQSKAVIKMNTNEVTTIKENKLIFDIFLKTNELSDRLYANPKVFINLPEEVTDINISDVQILYTNDLRVSNYKVNGKQLMINLEGFQRRYNLNSAIEGPLVRIVSNIKLNNLSPSIERNVDVNIINGASNETLGVSDRLKILSPEQIITVNGLYDRNNVVISQNDMENYFSIDSKSKEKIINSNGIIINNTSKNISNFKVLGRFISNNSKMTDGSNKDLNSQIDTEIISEIKLNGLKNYTIYYSSNPEANIDLNNPDNGWTNQISNNTKSYLIVSEDVLINGQRIDFNYQFKIPENIDYSKIGKTVYSVYYSTGEIIGDVNKYSNSKVVGIKSSDIPELNSSVRIFDYNTNVEYQNGQEIPSGRLIKYVLSIRNTGRDVAKDLKYSISANEYTARYVFIDKFKNKYATAKLNKEGKINEIKPNETIDVEYLIYKDRIGEEGKTPYEDQQNAKVIFNVNADTYGYTQKIETNNKLSEGGVTTLFTPSAEDEFEVMDLGGEYSFTIYVKNDALTERNNVRVKINVPKELSFVNSDYSDVKYDERTRELTFDIGTLKTRYDIYKDGVNGEIDNSKQSYKKIAVSFKLNANADVKSEIELRADTFINVKQKVDESKTLKYSLKNVLNADVFVNSNVGNNNILLDTDKLEYISEVVNKSDNVQDILIINKLPEGLNIDKYYIKKGNEDEIEYNSSDLAVSVRNEVNPGENLKLRIITKPTLLGSTESIMPVSNVVNVYVNNNEYGNYKLNNIIKGTANRYSENFKKSGEQYKESKNDTEYKYNIGGNVWNDNNLNGIKDYDEILLKGLKVYLYNENGRDLVYDKDGKPVETITDDNGNYLFSNLKPGNYIVVIDYNSNKYNLTNYKLNSNDGMYTSKFIDKEVNNNKVAITDILKIDDSSIYNINLGLVSNVKFSLSLMQKINKVKIGNKVLSKKYFTNFDKVDISKKDLNNSKVYIEYGIIVKNNGLLPGYANSIVDYIPKGFEFDTIQNNGWYLADNGYVYNNSLSNVLLNPGESKELKLVLSYNLMNNGLKLTHNVVEIASSNSVDGLYDSNSKSLNQNEDEDDFAYADIYFTDNYVIKIIFKIMLLIIEIIVIAFLNVKDIKKYK